MKLLIAFAMLVLSVFPTIARQSDPGVNSISGQPAVPQYTYCEIIGNHLPSYNGDGILFDFGQQTKAWAYNWLRDSDGEKILFNSNIEALNYMIRRGWEFVQAFTSGEKGQNIHYLLRIQTSQLTETEQQRLLTEPRSKEDKKK